MKVSKLPACSHLVPELPRGTPGVGLVATPLQMIVLGWLDARRPNKEAIVKFVNLSILYDCFYGTEEIASHLQRIHTIRPLA